MGAKSVCWDCWGGCSVCDHRRTKKVWDAVVAVRVTKCKDGLVPSAYSLCLGGMRVSKGEERCEYEGRSARACACPRPSRSSTTRPALII